MKLSSIHILLIEDNPLDVILLKDTLTQDPFAIFELDVVERLKDGISFLQKNSVDIILLDLGLPDSSGLDTFFNVHSVVPEIPVIVMSGLSDDTFAFDAVHAGAQDYLVKNKEGWALASRTIRYSIERYQAQVALKESEQHWRLLIEHAADGIVLIKNGIMDYISPSARRMMGYEEDDIIHEKPDEMTHPDDIDSVVHAFQNILDDPSKVETLEYRYHHKSGEWLWVESTFSNMLTIKGVEALVINFRLIDDRKKAEIALRLNSETMQLAQMIGNVGSWEVSLTEKGDLIEPAICSDEAYRIYGLKPGSVAMTTEYITSRIHPEDRKEAVELYSNSIKERKDYSHEYRIICNDGSIRHIYDQSRMIYDDRTGKPLKIIGMMHDITERKEAEEQIALFKHSVDVHYDSAYWMDTSSRFVYVNKVGCDVLGYTYEELDGSHISLVNAKATSEAMDAVWKVLREKGVFHSESIHRRKDGKEFPVEIVTKYIQFGGKEYACGFARDITERKRNEELLRSSEEKFRQIVTWAPVGIYRSTKEGKLMMANKSFARILGYASPDELLGKNMPDEIYFDSAQRGRLITEYDTESKGYGSNIELIWKKKDGSPVWIDLTAHAIKGEGNETVYYEGFIADITQRKEDIEALKQSEERYRTISSLATDYMFKSEVLEDQTLQLKWVAGAFEAITGYDVAEFVEKGGWRNSLHLDDIKKDEADMKRLLSHQSVVTEIRTMKKSGEIVWVRVCAQPIWDEKKDVLSGIYGAVQDITERKQAEEALLQSELKYRTLIMSMNEGLIQVGNDDEIQFVNDRFCEMVGYSREELIGKIGHTLLMDEQHRRVVQKKNQLRLEGISDEYEIQIKKKTGEYIWVLVSGSSIYDDRQEVVGSLGVFTDITQQKLDIISLQESEQRFHSMFERHNAIMLLIEPDSGKIIDANPAAGSFYGYTIAELKDMKIDAINILPADEVKKRRAEAFRQDKNYFLFPHKLANGEIRTVEVHSSPIRIQGSTILFSIIHDVTERLQSEKALKESEEKYKNFFEEDLTGDLIVSLEGTIKSCNPAFVKIFGFATREEALSTNFSELYFSYDSFGHLVNQIRLEKKIENRELEMRRVDGKKLNIIENIVGKFDGEGNLVEIKGYMYDDTKRHELEQQLLQARKLEGLGTLAGGIAHDFNNILAIILGHSSLIEYLHDDPNKLKQSTDAIIKASERGAGLVKQLLTFARKTEVKMQSVQLNSIIQEVHSLMQETFPKTVLVTCSLDQQLPVVMGDQTQLHQVVLNLCVNARDAMQRGGILSIGTCVVHGSTLQGEFPKAEDRPYIQLVVRDNGVGMDEITKQRIFEPFFTTKEIGKGTGLGLAMVFSIVSNHNGFIDVQSTPGKGTTVLAYLPVDGEIIVCDEPKSKTMDDIPGGTETLLFVEDEEFIRKLVVTVLSSKGYHVLVACDGKEGLEQYTIHHNKIQLVLSDIGLPIMGGDELFVRIKEINSNAKIILASGYVNPDTRSLLEYAGAKHIITKPYSNVELLVKIREVLDGL